MLPLPTRKRCQVPLRRLLEHLKRQHPGQHRKSREMILEEFRILRDTSTGRDPFALFHPQHFFDRKPGHDMPFMSSPRLVSARKLRGHSHHRHPCCSAFGGTKRWGVLQPR